MKFFLNKDLLFLDVKDIFLTKKNMKESSIFC